MARTTAKADPSFIRPSELEGKPIDDHDGREVTEVSASLVKTGHGFEETLSLAKLHIPMDRRVMLVIPARCASHEYDFIYEGTGANKAKIEGECRETAVLEAEGVLLLDPDLLAEVVATHQARINEAREAAAKAKKESKGEFALPFAEPESKGGKPADKE